MRRQNNPTPWILIGFERTLQLTLDRFIKIKNMAFPQGSRTGID
jgi:hypothetical protein